MSNVVGHHAARRQVTASVQVTNTGKREGATVIQMYLQDVTASMSRPVKMLRGFKKVTSNRAKRKPLASRSTSTR